MDCAPTGCYAHSEPDGHCHYIRHIPCIEEIWSFDTKACSPCRKNVSAYLQSATLMRGSQITWSIIIGSSTSSWHPGIGEHTLGRIPPLLTCFCLAELHSQPLYTCSLSCVTFQTSVHHRLMSVLFLHLGCQTGRSQPLTPLLHLPIPVHQSLLLVLVLPADKLTTKVQPLVHLAQQLPIEGSSLGIHPLHLIFSWVAISIHHSWLTSHYCCSKQ